MTNNMLRSLLATAVAGVLLAAAGPLAAQDKPDIAKAKAEGKVVIYTSNRTEIADAQAKAFQEKYGIEVESIRQGSQKTIQRTFTELQAGSIGGDIVHCLCVAFVNDLKGRGWTIPFKTTYFDRIPAELKDPEGHWLAHRVTLILIAYNKNLVTTEPTSWKDLTDPKYKGKTTIGDANYGSIPLGLGEALSRNLGWEFFENIGKNEPLIFQSNVQNVQWLATGERWLGPITDYDAAAAIEKGEPVGLAYPSEGVVPLPGTSAILKGSKHPEAAKLFMEFLLSDEGQQSHLDGAQYPVRTDFPGPKAIKPMDQLKLMAVDFGRIEAEGNDIKDRYMRAVSTN
ncbi:MAG: extracellular solute-binding protein [Acetobacterales bacterium]